ncbi:unnamed protein product [Brugia timori]|nr:unnamed protein product [Brugia timori]
MFFCILLEDQGKCVGSADSGQLASVLQKLQRSIRD